MAGHPVDLYDDRGSKLVALTSDIFGHFTFAGLPAGDYFVAVPKEGGYGGLVFGGQGCSAVHCDVTGGVPITVARDARITGIDFALSQKIGEL